MKILPKFLVLLLIVLSCSQTDEQVGYYVDPTIGTISPLLQTTMPQVHRPHSMVRVYPVTEPRQVDKYLSDRVYGIYLNMPVYRKGGVSSVMATAGALKTAFRQAGSFVDKDSDSCHPWMHSTRFEDYGIDAAWTTTERTVIFRFSHEGGEEKNLLFRVAGEGEISIEGNQVVSGYESISEARQYFYAVLDHPMDTAGVFTGKGPQQETSVSGKGIGVWMTSSNIQELVVKVGISYISREQAKANLEKESLDKSFEEVTAESERIWEENLGRIQVSGGTERERRIFYTSLYRNFDRMVNQSEDGRYYSGFDHQVHEDERPFYNDDWNWDTYRGSHALQMILDPKMKSDQLQSLARMYEQSGWIPNFPGLVPLSTSSIGEGGEQLGFEQMIGNHWSSIVAEAVAKGVIGFDLEKLYEGLRKNSMEGTFIPWRSGPKTELDGYYDRLGYFPGLHKDEHEPYAYVDDRWEKRQCVSVTLEHSYDDWCLAQLAQKLGRTEDYEFFMKRSRYYRNLWDPSIRFFAPKDKEGNWIRPFNPEISEGYGARYYFTENSAWVHQFHVQHDIPEMIRLFGGEKAFADRLDEAYNRAPACGKFRYMGKLPDGTGLHGLIPCGNEPSFHVPYLYNYAGQAWKTQYRVRQIADVWFDDRPSGLAGDEDGGALCAWYVFTAMGFYPVNPASGEYAIGSPIFEKVSIKLDNGQKFVVLAKGASKDNKYIQKALLDGKPLTRPFITHADIMAGSTLELEMGNRPCHMWPQKN